VAARSDALGQLARVFQRMAREVRAREERLTHPVQELRIQVDEAKKVRAVAEITATDYFHNLQQRAQQLRDRRTS
jgi:two-component system cell cycle response regulator